MVLEPIASRRSISGQLVYFLGWLGMTVFGAALTPASIGHGTHQQLGLPPCPCVLLFNRPCPGCGLTTSFTALIHGRVREAFAAHWLGPFLYILMTVTALLALRGFLQGKRLYLHTPGFQRFLMAFTACFLIYGVARFITTDHYQSPYEQQFASEIKR